MPLLCHKKCFRPKKFYYFMNKFRKIFIQFRYEFHHPREFLSSLFLSVVIDILLDCCVGGFESTSENFNLISHSSRLLSFVEFEDENGKSSVLSLGKNVTALLPGSIPMELDRETYLFSCWKKPSTIESSKYNCENFIILFSSSAQENVTTTQQCHWESSLPSLLPIRRHRYTATIRSTSAPRGRVNGKILSRNVEKMQTIFELYDRPNMLIIFTNWF